MKKSRREFLKNSVAVTAIGVGTSRFGMLRETLAAAKMQGKKPLNNQNLNSIIPSDPNELTNWIKGPTGDFKAWVREKFQLTADQEQGLNSMKPAQINKIKDALRQAAANKAKLSVNVVMAPSTAAVRRSARGTGESMPTDGPPTGETTDGTPSRETTVEVEASTFPPSVKVKISCKKGAL